MINKSTNKKSLIECKIDAAKFWEKVKIGNPDECWEWQGGKNTTGYGLFSVRSTDEEYEHSGRSFTQRLAHRVAASLDRVVMPYDYIMHKCDNRSCCNPKHLRVGTALENHRDMVAKGRWNGSKKVFRISI